MTPYSISCAGIACWCRPDGRITRRRTAIIVSGAIPNLLKAGPEQVRAEASEQVWVADITYLPTRRRCAYLSLVTDAYSRKIVGYHVHDSLHTAEISQALKMALKGRQGSRPLIHHSDRGIQYCAHEYQAIHQKYGLICSMTDGYDCYQNALAERVNGILKQDLAPDNGGFRSGTAYGSSVDHHLQHGTATLLVTIENAR